MKKYLFNKFLFRKKNRGYELEYKMKIASIIKLKR